jgi:predicted nucleotidyltransferase
MDFKIMEKEKPNTERYPSNDFDYAKRFSNLLKEELKDFLMAVILFGSAARNEKPLYGERDIDVLVVIDDMTQVLSPEVIQSYRVITEQTAAKVSKRLHITTLKLTSFWEYVRNGDPIAINILRDGLSLYDVGFYDPLQQLLFQGRIRPSREAIWTYFARAPATLNNADWHLLQATLDLYWAVVDSAHAALMKLGEVPPTPGHIADLIRTKMVKMGIVELKYAKTMQMFYDLSKKITHREVRKISGKDYDKYRLQAKDFVKMMQTVVTKREY